MDKRRFVDFDLIKKFVKKSKIKELKIKREVNSLNIIFIFLFILGFAAVIIFYRYIEKKRLDEDEKKLEEEKEEKSDINISIKEDPVLKPLQVRNVVVQVEDEKKRDQKEEELRKKFTIDLNK